MAPERLRPPYPEIYEGLTSGRVIPFLGAGAPLYSRNPKVTPWMQKSQGQPSYNFLPTATELADFLGTRADLPSSEMGELTKMAQYFETVMGSEPLREKLQNIFSHAQPPTPLHEFLAAIPAPLLIVTTNYDDMMERAFQSVGKNFDVVVHITDGEKVLWFSHEKPEPEEVATDELLLELDRVPVIYKMHGAIDRRPKCLGQYVITEDDYVEFLTRMTKQTVIPTIFAEPFQTRPFLFLGYGLCDWNLRVILNRIQAFRGYSKYRSWAIETLRKPVERELWKARNVNIYDDLTLEQFLQELKRSQELTTKDEQARPVDAQEQ